MELEGRHVVVTGAANGIGRALATRFHHQGARVVASDRDVEALTAVVEDLNAKRPRSAIAVAVDIGTELGNQQLVAM
ncbi:MAG: SDR family NAD(P)-dependent oxidoreductase, partial [Ilumatobacteraceae bacterium]